MKVTSFIAIAIFVGFAVNVPLILMGASRSTLLIVDVVLAGLWFFNHDSAADDVFQTFLVYGFIFSLWSVLGLLIVVILSLLSFDMKLPGSAYVIAATGLFGVVREMSKSSSEN